MRSRQAALSAALRLAAHGWPVLPCEPGGKRPLTRHGVYDASTDPDRIAHWWRRTPGANLAVPTGAPTADVLDIDVHPDGTGFPALDLLHRAGLLAGHGRAVSTPSGGLHLYFAGTDRASGRLAEQHVDLKARGGYVLVPPSVVDGRGYHLLPGTTGRPTTELDWDAVRALLAPRRPETSRHGAGRPGGGIAALVRWVERLPPGQRNSGTFWAACRAVEQGVDDLRPLVDAAARAGLPRGEATRTVISAAASASRPGAAIVTDK